MSNPQVEQERENRDRIVGGSVTATEEKDILAAIDQGGFRNKSQGARVILLAYTRSAKVRDFVASYLRDNIDLLAS